MDGSAGTEDQEGRSYRHSGDDLSGLHQRIVAASSSSRSVDETRCWLLVLACL